MVPLADDFDLEVRQPRHHSDFFHRVVERIPIVFRLHPAGLMDNRSEMGTLRRQKEGREESTVRREDAASLGQTADDVIGEEMGENRERQKEVELFVEEAQLEALTKFQLRTLVFQAGDLQFVPTRFEQRTIDVDPVVIPGGEIVDCMNPTAQRAAPNVEELMVRFQPLGAEKIELPPADLLPFAADHVAMPSRLDLFRGELPVVFVDLAHVAESLRTFGLLVLFSQL